MIYSEKLCDGVLTFDTHRTWWKWLKKAWESYLLLDYGLPEWDFDKQIVLKITKFDQFTLILTLYKNVTEMEII